MVISKLSSKIAKSLKSHDPKNVYNHEILEWQIGIYLNYSATIVLTVLFGWAINHFIESLFVMVLFIFVRKFSGGFHMDSLTLCAIISAALFAFIPTIQLSNSMVLIINIINLLIFIWMAPNSFEDLNPSPIDPHKKIISSIIVSSNFFINSPLIALTFLLQAILILPFWKGGEKSYEKADRT